jgi:hypothetical protein
LTVDEVAYAFWEGLDTPVSLSCYFLLKYGELDQLVRKGVKANDYANWKAFEDDYLAVSLLAKFPFPGFRDRCYKAAIDTFYEGEASNRVTNARIRAISSGQWLAAQSADVIACVHDLYRARGKIHRVLGSFRPREWLEAMRWSGGSNTAVRGSRVSAYMKFGVQPESTSHLAAVAAQVVGLSPTWMRSLGIEPEGPCSYTDIKVVSGNLMQVVPKNAKTDRLIALEPHLNIYCQLGLGTMIRRRLKRVGIDLNDQSVNQDLARVGSLSGDLATLDVKNASGTLSYEIVRFLLPEDWFNVLNMCRCQTGTLDGREVRYEMFSSMGNGATFELESLIFWALCKTRSQSTSVYGDDLVVDSDSYERVKALLAFSGFTLNEAKSFASGVFRESCGSDYFSGVNVRPYFLDEVLSDVHSKYRLANSVSRLAGRRCAGHSRDARFRACYDTVVKHIPKDLRLAIPEGVGDIGLVSSFDDACPRRAGQSFYTARRREGERVLDSPQPRTGWEGYVYRAYFPSSVSDEKKGHALVSVRLTEVRGPVVIPYPAFLHSLARVERGWLGGWENPPDSGAGNKVPRRRNAQRYAVSEGLVPFWPYLGPWSK